VAYAAGGAPDEQSAGDLGDVVGFSEDRGDAAAESPPVFSLRFRGANFLTGKLGTNGSRHAAIVFDGACKRARPRPGSTTSRW
jgi:hypothetical protein